VVLGEIEGRAKLQRSRNDGPSCKETNKDEHRKAGQGGGDKPRHDADDALECQKSPTFLLSCRAYGGNNRQDAIEDQIKRTGRRVTTTSDPGKKAMKPMMSPKTPRAQ
jgi:hypothetical protein